MSFDTGSRRAEGGHAVEKASNPARRRFLEQASTATSGLVIAMYLPGCSKPVEQQQQVAALANPSAPVTPNAWLRVATDGAITVLCDRSEMGQGVYTALPMLIAEELEVGLDQIAVEFAPAREVYTNQLLGSQVTGGSTSVRAAWEKLRKAGAEARARLVTAAAQHFGVDPSACRAERGAVVDDAGHRASYGELAEAAAELTAADGGEITFAGGKVEQQTFDSYRMLHTSEMPALDLFLVHSLETPGGMGEPTTAVIAPALCNAIFAATGKCLRSLPVAKHGFRI
jgi:CO/xanthine dehydrogenase Mo-binding subunit